MSKVMTVLMPVVIMMGIGMLCRKRSWLSKQAIDGLKFLMTRIILPVAVFNALATNRFTMDSFVMIVIMLVMLILSFGAGFLMRPLMPEPYRKYTPFMVSVYEGGMMGYPLYTSLVGAEHISNIALLDIAGLLFGFSIYMSMLSQTEENRRPEAKRMLLDALQNPSFLAAVFGLTIGLTGVMPQFLQSGAGETYRAAIDMITAPLSSMILIVVGYEIIPHRSMLCPCLRTIFLRVLLQTAMIFLVLWVSHLLIGRNTLMDLAVISYMSSPATFSMQSFLKSEEGGAYVSTTNSLYCFVSIAVYTAMAAIFL